ncbi:hypothetical protein [Nostoc sp.]|uniref:hypothetical protein n=1 Tax=Nostoc sp. TaxID=1180 RepID=UPI002FF6A7FE
MNIYNIIAAIGGTTAILSAIYKLLIEPSIDAKIASLQLNINSQISNSTTTNLITAENLKDRLNDKFISLDRKVDIHLQDYTNYKEAVLLQHNGIIDVIKHNWNKTEKLFNSEKQK